MTELRSVVTSVRGRATLAAMLVVGLALTAGAVLFDAALTNTVEDAAVASSEGSAERISARIQPDGSGLGSDFDDDEYVQVLTPDNVIVGASPDAEDIPPLEEGRGMVDDDPVIVARDGVKNSQLVVMVAHEIDDGLEIVSTARNLLAIAIPILVALVGAGAWVLTGRALAPVTRIRAQAEAIQASRLHQRLPVPETKDEIADLAESLNQMLDRLDTSARRQKQFVADASHELRSPLATIHQHAEVAVLHPGSVPVDELAQVVLAEGARLQELVDALLLLARLEETDERLRQPVDVDDLAIEEVHRTRRAEIVVDGSAIQSARVAGDARLVAPVIRNLVDNAVRHANTRVEVALTTRGDTVVLTVDDDGRGIPPEARSVVFDRFVRLDEARARDAGGAGLGLAIVREIVEALHGTVVIESAPAGGARFVVTLPRYGA